MITDSQKSCNLMRGVLKEFSPTLFPHCSWSTILLMRRRQQLYVRHLHNMSRLIREMISCSVKLPLKWQWETDLLNIYLCNQNNFQYMSWSNSPRMTSLNTSNQVWLELTVLKSLSTILRPRNFNQSSDLRKSQKRMKAQSILQLVRTTKKL